MATYHEPQHGPDESGGQRVVGHAKPHAPTRGEINERSEGSRRTNRHQLLEPNSSEQADGNDDHKAGDRRVGPVPRASDNERQHRREDPDEQPRSHAQELTDSDCKRTAARARQNQPHILLRPVLPGHDHAALWRRFGVPGPKARNRSSFRHIAGLADGEDRGLGRPRSVAGLGRHDHQPSTGRCCQGSALAHWSIGRTKLMRERVSVAQADSRRLRLSRLGSVSARQFAGRVAIVVTISDSLMLMPGYIRHLTSEGFEVHFVSSAGPLHEEALREGAVAVHAIEMTRRISPLADVRALVALWRLFRRSGFDVVHAGTPKAGLLGMLAAWVARVPCRVFTLHGVLFPVATGIERPLLWLSDLVSLRLATRRITVSQHLQEVAERWRLCARSDLTVPGHGSSNGVDTEFFRRSVPASQAAARRDWDVAETDVVVGFLGRLVPEKGVGDLVQAMQLVWPEVPHARLVLAGPEEPDSPLPPELRATLTSDPRIRPLGRLDGREAVRDVLEGFDVLALPTWREGFGNVLLEAASMEIATVGSARTGCADALADGETGLLVPIRDTEALAAVLIRLLKDDELRRNLASNGHRRAVRLFQPEIIWREVADLYRLEPSCLATS